MRIDGNQITLIPNPANPLGSSMQGISSSDGDWTDVAILRNVIETDACNGINWGSIHCGLIAHNSILKTGKNESNRKPGLTPFMGTHEYSAGSDHVVAVDNVAPALSATFGSLPPPAGSVATVNLVRGLPLPTWNGTGLTWNTTPGAHQGNMLVAGTQGVFKSHAAPLDLHPALSSPALGIGVSTVP